MARLGVETAGRAFSSINTTMVAIYCERYSLQSPWELVGRSARSARMDDRALVPSDGTGGGKGLTPFLLRSYGALAPLAMVEPSVARERV